MLLLPACCIFCSCSFCKLSLKGDISTVECICHKWRVINSYKSNTPMYPALEKPLLCSPTHHLLPKGNCYPDVWQHTFVWSVCVLYSDVVIVFLGAWLFPSSIMFVRVVDTACAISHCVDTIQCIHSTADGHVFGGHVCGCLMGMYLGMELLVRIHWALADTASFPKSWHQSTL